MLAQQIPRPMHAWQLQKCAYYAISCILRGNGIGMGSAQVFGNMNGSTPLACDCNESNKSTCVQVQEKMFCWLCSAALDDCLQSFMHTARSYSIGICCRLRISMLCSGVADRVHVEQTVPSG